MSRDNRDPNLYARYSLQASYNPAGGSTVEEPFFQVKDDPNSFMISSVDYERGDEVLEWLDERGLGHLPTMYLGFVEITFPDSDDAMLFKLVFG